MLISGIDKIVVNLIADHDHMMPQTDLSQLLQFLCRPHSAHRVVRVAQNKQFYMFLLKLTLKIFKINPVSVISTLPSRFLIDQCIVNYSPVIVTDNISKRIIHRILNQYSISRISKCFNRCTESKYHTRSLHDPFPLRLPIMIPLHPVHHSIVVSILWLGIAVDSMFYRSMKTLRDLFGYREIHIRHPQGQHICRLSSLHRKIIFQTIRSLPVRNLIKIVSSHTNSLTFRQSANFLPVAPGCRLNFIGCMHSSRPSARPDTPHRCWPSVKLSTELAELLCIPGYTHTKQMPALNLPADHQCSQYLRTFSEASHPRPMLHVPQPVHLHGSASSDRSEGFPRRPDSPQNGSI